MTSTRTSSRPSSIPTDAMTTLLMDDVRSRVNRFYEDLPFNIQQSPADAARTIRAGNTISAQYPALHTLLQRRRRQRLLEVGSGAGWFANTAGLHYPSTTIEAIDLCDHALTFARGVSAKLAVSSRVRFLKRDIFDLTINDFDARFDIVNSLGVLHHTHDCHAALMRVLPLVAPGGFLHLGLYHLHGRAPFLELFREIRDRLDDQDAADWPRLEAEAFARYRALYPRSFSDERWLRSWFRDQVLHPHETQHTAKEVHGWLSAAGFECVTTSLTRFTPVSDWTAVLEDEPLLEELSYRKNVIERTYYPGFFVMVARRPEAQR